MDLLKYVLVTDKNMKNTWESETSCSLNTSTHSLANQTAMWKLYVDFTQHKLYLQRGNGLQCITSVHSVWPCLFLDYLHQTQVEDGVILHKRDVREKSICSACWFLIQSQGAALALETANVQVKMCQSFNCWTSCLISTAEKLYFLCSYQGTQHPGSLNIFSSQIPF